MHYVKEKENKRLKKISFAEQTAQENSDIFVCKTFIHALMSKMQLTKVNILHRMKMDRVLP